MNVLRKLYRDSLALATDLYQLTMAYGYWKSGAAEKEAVFHLFFRKNPFGGGYGVACGLTYLIDLLEIFQFDDSDLAFLATLKGNDDKPLFDPGFLEYLREMRFMCDIDSVPEGTVVFPHEPLVRVTGPIIQGQILETPLLNIMNYQTLVATKAARVCQATRGEPVLEFGLRRAQGLDGAVAASWAAHVGGCAATSNVLAGKLLGIPVRGTHAHSWIMSYDDELTAFKAYAKAMPNNCVFLVDTYDTMEGVRNAVKVGRWLRQHGHKMVGIRLDSGDLAYLSAEARKILDAGGFTDALIIASNDLDEQIIDSLKDQGAQINIWGVGTKLVTAYDQPALGGVYKLSAVRNPGGKWQHRIKLSEQSIKISTPGVQQVRRFYNARECVGDMIYDTGLGASARPTMIDPQDMTHRKKLPASASHVDLLKPIFEKGKLVYQAPGLEEIRRYSQHQRDQFHPGIKRFVNPHRYPVGLEQGLYDLKTKLVMKARGVKK
jgi:nicotinate phosphoribosyltransferase